jgi:hypothetical protein
MSVVSPRNVALAPRCFGSTNTVTPTPRLRQPSADADTPNNVRLSGANDRSVVDLLSEFEVLRRSTIALFSGLPQEV